MIPIILSGLFVAVLVGYGLSVLLLDIHFGLGTKNDLSRPLPNRSLGDPTCGWRSANADRDEHLGPSTQTYTDACPHWSRICPICPRTRIVAVTQPEVLTIADYVKRTRSADAVESIRITAQANAEKIVGPTSLGDIPSCALQAEDGTCLGGPALPLACYNDETVGNVKVHEGLRLAESDTTTYELNGALAVALTLPSGAHRWSQGEEVFAGCRVRGMKD